MHTDVHHGHHVEEVAAWRREQLVASGFTPTLAGALAQDSAYDLHALIELVELGCPPALAIRIVAPLEDGKAA
jgi:hypothetical protein